jgi:hypothetical protein
LIGTPFNKRKSELKIPQTINTLTVSLTLTSVVGMLQHEHDNRGNAIQGECVGSALGVEGDGQKRVAQRVHNAPVQILGKGGQGERHVVRQRLEQLLAQKRRQTLEGLDERLAHADLVVLHARHHLDQVAERVVQRRVVELGQDFGAVGGRVHVGLLVRDGSLSNWQLKTN